MTPEEREAIREQHHEFTTPQGATFCQHCGTYWPCDAARLADALTEAEAERDRLRKALAAYVEAQGRTLDRWAEGDDAVHVCEDPARAALRAHREARP